MPTPLSPISHLLGRPSAKERAAIFARVAAQHRKEIAKQQAAARREAPKSATSRAPALQRLSQPASPAKQRPAATLSFGHLNGAVGYDETPEPTSTAGAPQKVVATATSILGAAVKARKPTGVGAPLPTGMAKKILDAGKKRRGEIGAPAAPKGSFAERVIMAGKRRRGET